MWLSLILSMFLDMFIWCWGRYGRKLTERDLQNRELDGEEAEELAGGFGWEPCVFAFVFLVFEVILRELQLL